MHIGIEAKAEIQFWNGTGVTKRVSKTRSFETFMNYWFDKPDFRYCKLRAYNPDTGEVTKRPFAYFGRKSDGSIYYQYP